MKKIFFQKLFPVVSFIFSFYYQTHAQVPVSKEPRHHNVFENEYVRLLDVRIQPGDTTQVHIHATPSVFISLSNAKSGSQVISEEQKPPATDYDGIWFEGFYKQPRIHRVWNSDTILFHVIDVELLLKKHTDAVKPLEINHAKFLFEEKEARLYRVNLNAAENFIIDNHELPLLLIALSESNAEIAYHNTAITKSFAKGDFFWIDGGEKFSLQNVSDGAAFVLIEFK
ncbi:MAG TPA: hypothetical protein PL045_06475 [Chitinophagaceae bacterium]|nr:hypothetical protein [Chitinophagaceae bacterium]